MIFVCNLKNSNKIIINQQFYNATFNEGKNCVKFILKSDFSFILNKTNFYAHVFSTNALKLETKKSNLTVLNKIYFLSSENIHKLRKYLLFFRVYLNKVILKIYLNEY